VCSAAECNKLPLCKLLHAAGTRSLLTRRGVGYILLHASTAAHAKPRESGTSKLGTGMLRHALGSSTPSSEPERGCQHSGWQQATTHMLAGNIKQARSCSGCRWQCRYMQSPLPPQHLQAPQFTPQHPPVQRDCQGARIRCGAVLCDAVLPLQLYTAMFSFTHRQASTLSEAHRGR
jgi:hypothetical protein